MEILFEDTHFLAYNKASGLPVQPDLTRANSLMEMVESKHGKTLHLLTRIDRPASGIILFAKNKKSASSFSELIRSRNINKKYLVASKNKPEVESETLIHYIYKKNQKAFISDDPSKGKKAILQYKLAGKSEYYNFIEIKLVTGRFHQIRTQMAHINCPVKGDVKYGARRANKDRSIHLHCFSLAFVHPFTGKNIEIIAALPDDPVWSAFEGS